MTDAQILKLVDKGDPIDHICELAQVSRKKVELVITNAQELESIPIAMADAVSTVEAMTGQQALDYLARCQTMFWAVASAVEDKLGIEICTTDDLEGLTVEQARAER